MDIPSEQSLITALLEKFGDGYDTIRNRVQQAKMYSFFIIITFNSSLTPLIVHTKNSGIKFNFIKRL